MRKAARGRDETTPLRLLGGVAAVVYAVVGLVVLAALLIWMLV